MTIPRSAPSPEAMKDDFELRLQALKDVWERRQNYDPYAVDPFVAKLFALIEERRFVPSAETILARATPAQLYAALFNQQGLPAPRDGAALLAEARFLLEHAKFPIPSDGQHRDDFLKRLAASDPETR